MLPIVENMLKDAESLRHAGPGRADADLERDRELRAIDARHLFEINLTKLAVRRGSFLRSHVHEFIETFASPLKRDVVERALATAPGTRIEL